MRSKHVFIFFLLIFVCACTKEEYNFKKENEVVTNTIKNVSAEEAQQFASSIAYKLFSNENELYSARNVVGIKREFLACKPIISLENDTVMYVINFKNDLGFIIVNADKQSFPIIAYADSGSFNFNFLKEDSPLSAWLNVKAAEVSQRLKQLRDSTKLNHLLWENIIPNDTTEIEIEFAALTKIPRALRETRNYTTGKATIYPFTGTHYKWGQGIGYNNNAPFPGAQAGCPAVAIGKLCVHHWFPNKYGYQHMPGELPANYNKKNAISYMFRDIANLIPNYQWGINASGAYPNDITTGLRRLGYKNAELRTYNFDIAYANLSARNPILLAGYQSLSKNGGHIWFCDGYHEFSWTIKLYRKEQVAGKKLVKQFSVYADYLHMNWGWGGTTGVGANGWYEQANWNPTDAGNQGYYKQMYINLYPANN